MDNQRQADEVKILAGFFAGEGHIGIRKSNRKSKSPTLCIEVGNTERYWCELFQKHFGGSVRTRIAKKRLNHLPYHKWYVKDEKAAYVLRQLFPFLLGEKRGQVAIALQLAAIKAKKPNRGRAGKNGHFNDMDIRSMERLEVELKEFRRAAAETKRTGVVSSPRSDSPTLQATAD